MLTVRGGRPEPLGVDIGEGGVNVAVRSAHATAIWFCLFDETGAEEIVRVRLSERLGPVHHGWIAGVKPGDRYGLRAEGPYDPQAGHLFNPAKLLIDPYAAVLDRPFRLATSMFDRRRQCAATDGVDSAPDVPKAIVTLPPSAQRDAAPPAIRASDRVVYELSVRAFTKLHPDVPGPLRGTLAGLTAPGPLTHLRDLGITTVKLMPLAAWIDERHLPPLGLSNAWGYNPVVFGAPDPHLVPGGWNEIRAAVDRLHAAGLEVLLDVVVNHTGESDADGPTLSLRGLDNAGYYRLSADRPGEFVNDTGCGNTLSLDRPHVVRLVMDSLRRWALWGGIDGFRFDLATVLGRRADGFDPAAPLLTAIAQDPVLSQLTLVAEPWDLGPGGYQLGHFPPPWFEWNDRFRDTVRRFWRGDAGLIGDLATRISGSSDVFAGKRPSRSVNFVTAHDGFTLRDLVSYATKHNDANGEQNRDGRDENFSWNNGVEGETAEAAIVAARRRDQKNLLATLLLSRGTPMLSMGADLGHSQRGNNNAYAQDNATTWVHWANRDRDLVETVRRLVTLRREHRAVRCDTFLTGRADADEPADVTWLARDGEPMTSSEWSNAGVKSLACRLFVPAVDGDRADDVVIVLNASREGIVQTLPALRDGEEWDCAFETSTGECRPVESDRTWRIAPRTVAVFEPRRRTRTVSDPPASDALDRLARMVGIAPEWWEISGRHHRVSDETKRAMLASMGLPAGSSGEVRDALGEMTARERARLLPRITIANDGEPVVMPLSERRSAAIPARLIAVSEAGEARMIPLQIGRGERGDLVGWLTALPAGIWRLSRERQPDATATLIVAPKACYLPEPLQRERGAYGVSAQLYGLRRPGDQGVGDLTTLAHLAVAAGQAGAAVVGINPLHALFGFDRTRASPYYPSDRRFIDELYIDVEALCEELNSAAGRAALAANASLFADLRAAATIDYPAVAAAKRRVLAAIFADFDARPATDRLTAEYLAFVAAGGTALQAFAAFEAKSIVSLQENADHGTRFAAFVQWAADRQLTAAAAGGRQAGLSVGLYRDLAVGAAPDGAEVASGGRRFVRNVSIGAPPDAFSEQGQVWGVTPWSPLALLDEGLLPFRQLIEANMRHAGALRIDHVLGLRRQFWVPEGAEAKDGAYIAFPEQAMQATLRLLSHRMGVAVVGEDLGTVPEGLRDAMAQSAILGTRVMPFERDTAGLLPPSGYPRLTVSCAATHDLPPLAAWWAGDDLVERERIGILPATEVGRAKAERTAEKQSWTAALEAAGLGAFPAAGELSAELLAAIHRFLSISPSALVLVQAEDLAGSRAIVNVPGTDSERPNWRARLDNPIENIFSSPQSRTVLSAFALRKG
jgi:glycogen debranching enzyme GlgX